MQGKFESFVRALYLSWKKDKGRDLDAHPDAEEILSFTEGKLGSRESSRIQEHLIHCDACMEKLCISFELGQVESFEDVPEGALEKAKLLSDSSFNASVLDICLQLKNGLLEIIRATGNVLIGQELIPAPVLRSRSLKEFKDNITILKDFDSVRIKTKIENRGGSGLSLYVYISYKDLQKTPDNIRASLFKGDLEVESYVAKDSVVFEHILPGCYRIIISDGSSELAVVSLEIKV